ncbi:hypothetical protein DOTSEDRAFT_113824, partial [Dothistroma septosporum NZE10]
YDHSHLIFFSILGVLARLGLVALTSYPGAPIATTVVWANVGGSLIMGFLREDRLLVSKVQGDMETETDGNDSPQPDYHTAAREAYITTRSTLHVFIGMTVGFCGTFTSFADVIRDAFYAISDDLSTVVISDEESSGNMRARNDGDSVLAVVAVLWIEVSMSLAALQLGGHLAIATEHLADVLPTTKRPFEPTINILAVVVGWGAWIGVVMMAIWAPHDSWHGQAIFAVIFAPIGAVLRFHLAKQLNPKLRSFPLGTFAANVFGTCVLGMLLNLQHSGTGSGQISCQVLQGVGDGFCGGLTTVSTWVLELKSLRTKHGYFYAFTSLVVSLSCMVVIRGPLRWTAGFEPLQSAT